MVGGSTGLGIVPKKTVFFSASLNISWGVRCLKKTNIIWCSHPFKESRWMNWKAPSSLKLEKIYAYIWYEFNKKYNDLMSDEC